MSSKQKEFKIPPVSPLIGCTVPNFFRVLTLGKVAPRYWPRLTLTFLVILISTPFQLAEYLYYRKKVKRFRFTKSPIFIIGHWRSGTTHLHNLLCKDPNHGFVTTYQGVFPNNLLTKWIFKTFMRIHIPETRPADNVRLSPDYPQEEEFAFGNMTKATFYHFFYFPSLNDQLFDKYIRMHGLKEKERHSLKRKYNELLVKAALNIRKDRMVVKNPANTGKIKLLLEMYPEAKFIYIYRNPVITYLSTIKFYASLLPSTCLEDYTTELVKEKVIQNYKNLMHDYFESKKLIPKENLIEIKFEDFDENNLDFLKRIYDHLGLETWEDASPHLKTYALAHKHYKKNKYTITKPELDKVLKEWSFAMERFGYEIPDNLDII